MLLENIEVRVCFYLMSFHDRLEHLDRLEDVLVVASDYRNGKTHGVDDDAGHPSEVDEKNDNK